MGSGGRERREDREWTEKKRRHNKRDRGKMWKEKSTDDGKIVGISTAAFRQKVRKWNKTRSNADLFLLLQPFNAFLSGFSATVGQFVLTASLRIQTNPENKDEFKTVSHERYVFPSTTQDINCREQPAYIGCV